MKKNIWKSGKRLLLLLLKSVPDGRLQFDKVRLNAHFSDSGALLHQDGLFLCQFFPEGRPVKCGQRLDFGDSEISEIDIRIVFFHGLVRHVFPEEIQNWFPDRFKHWRVLDLGVCHENDGIFHQLRHFERGKQFVGGLVVRFGVSRFRNRFLCREKSEKQQQDNSGRKDIFFHFDNPLVGFELNGTILFQG